MLYLKALHVENLFQYREFDIAFAPGINLILGPNGSGKTNLLNCLYFALTGELPAKKSDCIRRGGGDSFLVELNLEIDAKPLIIRRSNKSHSLICDSTSIEGLNQVNEALGNLLGIDIQLLEKLIFLSGSHLRGLINCSSKERLEFFQSLLPIKSMQKLWNDMGHWIAVKQAELSHDYTMECNEYAKLETEIQLYGDVRSSAKIAEEINRLDRYCEVKLQYDRVFDKYSEASSRYRQAQERIELIQQNYPKTDPLMEKLVPLYDQLTQLRKQALATLQRWRQRPPVKHGPSEKEIENAKINLGVLRQHAQQLQQILELLEERDECPVCHSHIDRFQLAEQYRNELVRTISELRKQEQQIRNLEQQRKEAQENAKLRANLRKELEIIRQQQRRLLNNTNYRLRNIDFASLEQYLKDRQQAKNAEIKIQQLLQEQAYHKGLMESYDRQLSELKNKMISITLESDDFDYNELNICNLSKKLQKEYELAKRVEECKLKLNMLQNYVKLHEEIKTKRNRLEIIKQVRSIFHTEGAPKLLTRRFLNALNANINKILDILHTNYAVAFLEDGSCRVQYQTGAQFSEKQLSYGEQLMLALALYITLGSLNHSLKLLILDEPTIGLDDDHVERVPVMLLNLLKDTGMQIVCATHEKKLLPAATQVVELTTPVTSS